VVGVVMLRTLSLLNSRSPTPIDVNRCEPRYELNSLAVGATPRRHHDGDLATSRAAAMAFP
jgi:hypothetical protein